MASSPATFLPPRLEMAYQRARRRWQLALATPLVYLVIAQWLRGNGTASDAANPYPHDTESARIMLTAIAGVCMVGLIVMRLHQAGVARRATLPPSRVLRLWLRDFSLLAIFADSIAFIAFIYELISGRFEVLLVGGALAYLGYAIAHPRRGDLAGIAESSVPDEAE